LVRSIGEITTPASKQPPRIASGSANKREGVSEMEKDPVCGMDVDPATSEHPIQYQARIYYFCSPECRRAFEADPTEYVDPD